MVKMKNLKMNNFKIMRFKIKKMIQTISNFKMLRIGTIYTKNTYPSVFITKIYKDLLQK